MSDTYQLSQVDAPHLWETESEMIAFLTAPLSPAQLVWRLWQEDPEDSYLAGESPDLDWYSTVGDRLQADPEFQAARPRMVAAVREHFGIPLDWSDAQLTIAAQAGAVVERRELSEQWMRELLSSEFFANGGTRQPTS